MSFYKKYELDHLMADGEAKTFRAKENATGRVVFLHLFNPSGQPLLAVLQSKLGGDKGKPRPPLLEIGEFAGAPYAVTLAIEPFGNLRDWIAANVSDSNSLIDEDSSPSLAIAEPIVSNPDTGPLVVDQPRPERAPAMPPPIVPTPLASGLLDDGAGEFTRMFESDEERPKLPASGPRVPAAAGPGEFTKFFQTAEPEAPIVPRASTGGGLVSDSSGEFTKHFQDQLPAATPPPAAPAGSLQPGEFTRQFQEPFQPKPEPRISPGQAPGEFTKIFQPTDGPSMPRAGAGGGVAPPDPPMPRASAGRAPLWPPPSQNADSPQTDEFSGLFGTRIPGESIDIEKEHAKAVRSTPPENRPFQAAGEFTRMFGPQGVAGTGTPGAAPPVPPNTNTRISSASGMFGDPKMLAQLAAEALAGSHANSTPGEYTKDFAAPKRSGDEAKASTPAASVPEAPPKKSTLEAVLIVVAVFVLVVIVGLIVYLKR